MGPERAAEPAAVQPRNNYTTSDATLAQISGSWIYKGEWNGTISNKMYVEARYGVFGYYFPLHANTDSQAYQVVDAQLSQYLERRPERADSIGSGARPPGR